MMPAIILAINFESELGNYFEQAYSWHNRTGPHHTRSGFRMMEIQNYFWDFELPWWNAAIDNPSVCMPKTMRYLANNFEGDELERRRKQITRGLAKGREEVIKITKRYLMKPPILLILLTHHVHGGPFLRAVLSVLHEHEQSADDLNVALLIQDAGDAWGAYIYSNPSDRPQDEQLWYELLTKSDDTINDLVHFWQQFCLNWPVVTGDLQKLSKSNESTPAGDIAPLTVFEGKYPVLFECLYAVFGAMMSNSRLCEQIHGMMRHSLTPGIGMDQADHQRQYSAMTGFKMREERRLLGDGTSESREKRKKALHHDKTKEQQRHLCRQILDGAALFAERRANELTEDEISTVGEWKKSGRRAQDKVNLQKQITNEDRKASRLTRKKLDIIAITAIAMRTKPTNDATFTFNPLVILWREKVDEMCKVKFWATLNPKNNYKPTWRMARACLIHIDANPIAKWQKGTPHGPVIRKRDGTVRVTKRNKKGTNRQTYESTGTKLNEAGAEVQLKWNYFDWGDVGWSLYCKNSIYGGLSSYSRANEHISEYLSVTRKLVKYIYSFIKCGDEGGFHDKSVKKTDIQFLFVRYKADAFTGDEIVPAELAVCDSITRKVHDHFTYIVDKTNVENNNNNDDDGSMESGDESEDEFDQTGRVTMVEG